MTSNTGQAATIRRAAKYTGGRIGPALAGGEPLGAVYEIGALAALSQTLRAIIHSRVEIGMSSYVVNYPQTDIILIEPSTEDADMFFANLFSYNSRRRMCESVYQNTRMPALAAPQGDRPYAGAQRPAPEAACPAR